MPLPTRDQQKEKAQLEAAAAMVDKINKLTEQVPGLETGLTALDEAFKDVDVKAVLALVDQMKSQQDELKNMIRLSKGGIYVPGLGDTKEKFSVARASHAILTKDWKEAKFEEKVFKESREAMQKGAGHIIGVDSQGGYFVPDQVIPDIIGAIYAQSILLALNGSGTTRVSLLDGLVGIPVTFPKFLGGMVAYWLGEQDRYVESAVRVGNVSMRPRKLGVLTRITDEMRRFSSYGFETLMRNDMIRAAAALIDYTVLYGTGTDNMPRGVMNVAELHRYYAETHSDVAPAGNAVG
jgi:HK97 family phage major capsid protein